MILDTSALMAIVFREPGFERLLVHVREAVRAFRKYGRGRHPAALNFGDCMTYAVARLSGEPLLHWGEDFRLTDVERVEV